MNWRTMGREQRDELLSAYLDNELSADVCARLEARLANDAGLRTELDLLRRTTALVRQLEPLPVPRNFILPQSASRTQPARQPRSRLAWAAPLLTAATSAVGFLFAVVLAVQMLVPRMGYLVPAGAPVAQSQAVEVVTEEREPMLSASQPTAVAEAAGEAAAPEGERRAVTDEGGVALSATLPPGTAGVGAAEQPEAPAEAPLATDREKATEPHMVTQAPVPTMEPQTANATSAAEAEPVAPAAALPPGEVVTPSPVAMAGASEDVSAPPAADRYEEPQGVQPEDARIERGPSASPLSIWWPVDAVLGLVAVGLVPITVLAWRARRRQR